jgi:hypothetical protein
VPRERANFSPQVLAVEVDQFSLYLLEQLSQVLASSSQSIPRLTVPLDVPPEMSGREEEFEIWAS